MGSDAATGVEVSEDAPSVAATLRWTVPLAVVAVGFLMAVTFRSDPAPGLAGQGLAVTVVLVGIVAGQLAFERVAADPGVARLTMLLVMIGCAGTLVALQPDGPGFLGMMLPVAAAAFRLQRRAAAAIAALSLAAIALGAAFGKARPVDPVILDCLAVAAYFGVATFAGRFIRADERSQFVIAQLEATRVAEARAAALGERQRLAREMHDVLAHSLSGLVLNLEGARLMAERGVTGPQIEEAITRSHRLAKTGLEEAQRAIGVLREDTLPGPQGVAQLAAEFQEDTGVSCRYILEGHDRALDSDTRLTLYRIAQEALTNIRKHACPDRVEIHLSYEPTGIRLVVEDFEATEHTPPPGGGTGYGLTGMRERAELLGGTLAVGPTPAGFRVELWAPA